MYVVGGEKENDYTDKANTIHVIMTKYTELHIRTMRKNTIACCCGKQISFIIILGQINGNGAQLGMRKAQ